MKRRNKLSIYRLALISCLVVLMISCKKNDDSESVTDADGNKYKTVVIGNQTWMAENLRTTTFQDGTAINLVTDNTAWSYSGAAYCWYGNDQTTYEDFGILYNYFAVAGSKNLCPDGWHIPSSDEWTTLIDFAGGSTVAGSKLKESGTGHWFTPNSSENKYHFSATGGGMRDQFGLYDNLGENCFYWTSTAYSIDKGWYTILYYNNSSVLKNYWSKNAGFSVRCVKDN
ncbi:MAG TPA: fibrobacter succinogenes major paralogous domain-containing protein [Bacteroidales bacterium]|nr:fibrobacter succinogenes major paralogous domain-containing protein [Bacteroidales bacterium]